MIEHDGCKGCKYELEKEDSEYCTGCTQNAVDKYTRKTNADDLRSMTDEELADFLSVNVFCDCCSINDKCDAYQEDSCKNVFIKWLQSKAEE